MRAFQTEHNITKADVLAHLAAHRTADRIIQGAYWVRTREPEVDGIGTYSGPQFVATATDEGRGCAVGCTINTFAELTGDKLDHSLHQLYETFIGVPRSLARIEDGIFEQMDRDDALEWPERFITAIEPGADLSLVPYHLALRFLTDDPGPVVDALQDVPDEEDAVIALADAYRRYIDTGQIDVDAYRKLERPAPDSTWSMRSYQVTRVRDLCAVLANELTSGFTDYGHSVYDSFVYCATRMVTPTELADHLLEIIATAPVPVD